MMKTELKRGFVNWRFGASIIIGCVITVLYNFQFTIHRIITAENYANIVYGFGYPPSVFNNWFALDGYSVYPGLYYYTIPVLCAISYGDSFYRDKKSGYLKNILNKTTKKNYYVSKYVTTFLVGGMVSAAPLLVSLGATAMMVPSVIPNPVTAAFIIFSGDMGSELFYTHPYVYCFANIFMNFVFMGILSTLSLIATFFVKHHFAVLLTPFLFFCFVQFGTAALGKREFGFLNFLAAFQVKEYPGDIKLSIILVEGIILLLGTSSFFLWKGLKSETY